MLLSDTKIEAVCKYKNWQEDARLIAKEQLKKVVDELLTLVAEVETERCCEYPELHTFIQSLLKEVE